jgi:Ala-tRNA(Pro) deacylase
MNVATFLEEHNCRFERLPHEPTYSAQRLAQQLHVPGREIAKTVLLRAGSGNQFVVAVLPGSRKIDFEKVAKLFGNGKVQLATEFEIAAHCPDCEFGVLPPFGSRYGMKTIVDSNLAADEEIVFDANTHNEAIRMRFDDFVEFEDPLVAAIAVSE